MATYWCKSDAIHNYRGKMFPNELCCTWCHHTSLPSLSFIGVAKEYSMSGALQKDIIMILISVMTLTEATLASIRRWVNNL